MSASSQADEVTMDQQQAELAAVRIELDTARAQVADLRRRLDQAEADHRADRATWWTERARLLALVGVLTAPPLGRLARLTCAAREWRRA